ncbi:MAG TPA: hypothetical protein VFP72_09045 [Kineosporiaceae bacterium]|nr:hypothetical protein [Kineosporiaceae bacterium]
MPRRVAEQVGDVELETFIGGQQTILAMYCGYNHEQVIELADTAIGPSGRVLNCTGAAAAPRLALRRCPRSSARRRRTRRWTTCLSCWTPA